ncbi:putative regulator of Ras-like GTPase activity (Roadblock/LC7/MglB family) [Rubricella aquisinus]|uniref:Putative regulator of Ras-like GTPase activity (Roadblock/LC7/MglB family) n=1 Tax=Rubricella aquisinus TaxID=2028108 RepID=A0A840WM61_9RHOB|nr:hypothetical protein [Rubricella aquisinus]MBB5514742.1 putative regulator of Ras-like GTPase activity (Roadblock/LC7/MglB family) [Rubricella aquisinus]
MSVLQSLQKLCDHNDKIVAAGVVSGDDAVAHADGNYEFVDFAAIADLASQMFDASELLFDGEEDFASVYVEMDVHGLFAKQLKSGALLLVVAEPVLGAGLEKLRVAIDIFAKRLEQDLAKGAPIAAPRPRATEPLRADADGRIPEPREEATPDPKPEGDAAAKPKRLYRGVEY